MSVIAGVPADVEESGSFSASSNGLVIAMETPFRIRLFFVILSLWAFIHQSKPPTIIAGIDKGMQMSNRRRIPDKVERYRAG